MDKDGGHIPVVELFHSFSTHPDVMLDPKQGVDKTEYRGVLHGIAHGHVDLIHCFRQGHDHGH